MKSSKGGSFSLVEELEAEEAPKAANGLTPPGPAGLVVGTLKIDMDVVGGAGIANRPVDGLLVSSVELAGLAKRKGAVAAAKGTVNGDTVTAVGGANLT